MSAQAKLTRSEVVREAYELASHVLVSRADDGTVNEMLMTRFSEEDAGRIENELRKIGERLHYHTTNLKS
jgi:hypothetical protein